MQTTVSIPGIHCNSCARLIEEVSKEDSSITDVHVDAESKSVAIEHGEDFDAEKWKDQIEALDPAYRVQFVS